MTRFCEECEILFDCEYNLNKHNEIIHLSEYPKSFSLMSPSLRALGTAGIASALVGGIFR